MADSASHLLQVFGKDDGGVPYCGPQVVGVGVLLKPQHDTAAPTGRKIRGQVAHTSPESSHSICPREGQEDATRSLQQARQANEGCLTQKAATPHWPKSGCSIAPTLPFSFRQMFRKQAPPQLPATEADMVGSCSGIANFSLYR